MKDLAKKYYIKTYGCAMNYADSDRIRYVLDSAGLKEVSDFKKADFVILNSCSVRKQAEDKISGWGSKIKKFNLGGKIFVLTGCMAVRFNRGENSPSESYPEKLFKKYPWINYILDIQNISKLPQVLGISDAPIPTDSYLDITPASGSPFMANIPISTGCNFFCSYCIVPFSRGELSHRSYDEILKEAKLQIERGAKLICLVAQNVNSWKGLRNGRQIGFAELLEDVANIDGEFWVTFVSSNPMDFSDEIINVVSQNQNIARWLNIAVQSGSNKILKEMNRRYSVEEFEDLVAKIRECIPDVRLTTDIIVGFPGESRDDFEKTLNLVKKLEFQMIYVGKYSPRDGTLSARLEDNVPIEEKKRRERLLKKELNNMRKRFHNAFLGQEIDILMVGGRKGFSYYYHEVLLDEPIAEEKIGTFIKATVVETTLSGLIAKA